MKRSDDFNHRSLVVVPDLDRVGVGDSDDTWRAICQRASERREQFTEVDSLYVLREPIIDGNFEGQLR